MVSNGLCWVRGNPWVKLDLNNTWIGLGWIWGNPWVSLVSVAFWSARVGFGQSKGWVRVTFGLDLGNPSIGLDLSNPWIGLSWIWVESDIFKPRAVGFD